MFFSDVTDEVGAQFQLTPTPQPPSTAAPVEDDVPAQDWTAGVASAEATTTAFGHYTDPEPELPPVLATGPVGAEDAAAAAKKAVDDSLAMMNDALAKAKADEIAALTAEEADDDAFALPSMFEDSFGPSKEDKIASKLEGLPPDLRQKVLAELGGRDGDAALSEEQLDAVKNAEASVTEDEEHEKKMAKKTDDVADFAEKAAAADGDHTKAIEKQLDGLSPKRREEAMEKMSPEARAAAEEALENRKKRLENLAERLEKAQHGKGTTDCTDEAGIVAGLSGLSESEAEELSEIYGEKYKDGDDKPRSLRKDLQAEFGKDDKETKFIGAVFDGDMEEADEMSVDLAVSYLEDEAGAIVNSDEDAMNDILRAHNKNPEAAKRIIDAYRAKTGKELSAACEEVMDTLEFKEASANLEGDPRTANVAVLEQGNGERSERVIEDAELEPGGIETLTKDFKDHTGKKLGDELKEQLPAEKAEAVEAQIDATEKKMTEERNARLDAAVAKLAKDPVAFAAAKAKAEEVASKLDTALSKTHVMGNNTDVTDPLRGLSEAEVKLVMDTYAEKTASLDPDKKGKNLEEELAKKLEGKDLKVANAVMSGNKVLAAVAFVEQAADNAGTDVDGWKKSMETLTTKEEREEFLALMGKHRGGGKDAYKKLVRSETSSFDRDTLNAHAITDEDERKATLAQVEFTKNAYGGLIAGWQEGLQDTMGDVVGEDDAKRAERRQQMREYDVFTRFSNLGGSEDAQLDAMANLQNERQQQIFNEKVKGETGKTTEEIVSEEMSDHHEAAGLKFARGEYQDAQAERMVAELDCYVDNREDAASKPFEQVRLEKEQLERISAIPEGPERDKAIEAEKKTARASLLAKADQAAQKAGYEGYLDMLKAKGVSEADLDVAEERIADGKVSDATALFKAGDTTVGDLGKDAGKFYEVMKNKSPAEMGTLRKDFEAKHPDLNFDEWVRSKATSAGQKKDFEMMLEGNYARMEPKELAAKAADPDGQRALIKRVMDLEAAARGGADENPYDPIGNFKREVGNAAGNMLADNIGNAGERLDGRAEAVKKLEAKLDAGESLSQEEQTELVTHMRYMSGDQQAYTETKTDAVNTGAKVVGKVVEGGTIALTGNQTLATAAGGVAEIEVMGTFDPGRFGPDEAVAKLTEVAFNTAGSYVGGRMKNPLAGAAVEGMFGGAGSELGNTKNWNDAGQLVAATGKSMGNATVAAVASGGVEQIGGGGIGTKIASATAEELVSGDESATFKQRSLNIGRSVLEESVTDAGGDYHTKRSNRPSSDSSPTSPSTPRVEADPTPIDAPKTDADSGVDIRPVIQVDGDPTPIDAPKTDAESGVDIRPVIQVDGDPTPIDAQKTESDPDVDATDSDTTNDVDPQAPDAPASAFGDETSRSGRRILASEDGTRAVVSGKTIDFTFPDGMDDAGKRALVRDAMNKFGLDASDASITKAMEAQASGATEKVRVEQTLHVKSPEETARIAREIFADPALVAGRENHTAENLEGKCGKESVSIQERLAAKGVYAPVMEAKFDPDSGRAGHKYLIVGDQIIDPTFAQFFEKNSDKKDGHEPFVGTYDEMVARLASEGIADPEGLLAKQWGLQKPNKPGEPPGLDAGVVPFKGDNANKPVAVSSVDEARRLMAEQEAAGIPPGEGLPPELVRAATEPQVDTTRATPAERREVLDAIHEMEGPEAAEAARRETRHVPEPPGKDHVWPEGDGRDPLAPDPLPAPPPLILEPDDAPPRKADEPLPSLEPVDLKALAKKDRAEDDAALKAMRTPIQKVMDVIVRDVTNGETGVEQVDAAIKVIRAMSELPKRTKDPKKVSEGAQAAVQTTLKALTALLPQDLGKAAEQAIDEGFKAWNVHDPEPTLTKKLLEKPPEKQTIDDHADAVDEQKRLVQEEAKAHGETIEDYEAIVEARKRVLDQIQDRITLEEAMKDAKVDEDATYEFRPDLLPPEHHEIDLFTPEQREASDERRRAREQRVQETGRLESEIRLCSPEDLFFKRSLENLLATFRSPEPAASPPKTSTPPENPPAPKLRIAPPQLRIEAPRIDTQTLTDEEASKVEAEAVRVEQAALAEAEAAQAEQEALELARRRQ